MQVLLGNEMFTLPEGVAPKDFDPRDPIVRRFLRFHKRNPELFLHLKMLALRVKAAGKEQYSIAALFEVVRYDAAVKTTGEPWKINNNYRTLYARMLECSSPQLKGFFKTRHRRMTARLQRSWAA
jgi:hypothetical protein